MSSEHFFAPEFIGSLMQARHPQKHIEVNAVERFAVDNSASILVTLTSGTSEAFLGHFGLQVSWTEDGQPHTRKLVMKVKPHGKEISAMTNFLAQASGGALADIYPQYQASVGFENTHLRELAIYNQLSGAIMPEIFGTYSDTQQHIYIVLMEYLEEVALLNSVMEVDRWEDEHIRQALAQLAQWHAQYLNQDLPIPTEIWSDVNAPTYMTDRIPLWEALLENAAAKAPELYTPERVTKVQGWVGELPRMQAALAELPKTLIHNDANPRNTCFKGKNLCLYDWELATQHVPQYDVVELLSFVLDEHRYHQRREYFAYYQSELARYTEAYRDNDAFWRGVEIAGAYFGIHRLGLYMMAHGVSPYPFLPRVVNSYFHLMETVVNGDQQPA